MRLSLSLPGWRKTAAVVMALVVALVACKQTPPEPGRPVVTAGRLSPTTETPRPNTATPA